MQRLSVLLCFVAVALTGCATSEKVVQSYLRQPTDPRAAAPPQAVTFAHLQPDEFDQAVSPADVGVDSLAAPAQLGAPTDSSAHRAAKTKAGPTHSPGHTRGKAAPKPPTTAKRVIYACPMHPDVTDTTASVCPKCGMTLEPREEKP